MLNAPIPVFLKLLGLPYAVAHLRLYLLDCSCLCYTGSPLREGTVPLLVCCSSPFTLYNEASMNEWINHSQTTDLSGTSESPHCLASKSLHNRASPPVEWNFPPGLLSPARSLPVQTGNGCFSRPASYMYSIKKTCRHCSLSLPMAHPPPRP